MADMTTLVSLLFKVLINSSILMEWVVPQVFSDVLREFSILLAGTFR